jgi:alkylation response protein AidB-like acyl-CoA dehydrogenase
VRRSRPRPGPRPSPASTTAATTTWRWQQALGKKGWLPYTWPRKYGGPGFDVTQRFLFENVLAEEGAPRIIPFGVKMVGPVIYTFGTDEQKDRFLPGIRSSEVQWCQGYSEPGAGSDLASLRTRACATATTTSSTARRPGPLSPTGPTGSSAWCAPIRAPSRSRASPSC